MASATQQRAFLLLLILVTVAFFWLLLPYYGALFWAAILAILFQPMQRFLERKFNNRRGIAALVSVIICIFIVIIPVSIIIASLIQEGASVYFRIRSGAIDFNTYLTQFQNLLPASTEKWLNRLGFGGLSDVRLRLSAAVMQGSQLVIGHVVSIGQNTLQFLISLGVMLYLLFFLFRDGRFIAHQIHQAIPLSEAYTRQLLDKYIAVVRATVKGNVIIAIAQGIIGGITFWLLNIEAPLLWGVMMAFMSLLPAIGAAIVWLPVAAYLILNGDYFSGIVLIIVGTVVIGLVDNLLRPPLVGKETKLPDYVVLISTIGGMSIFGINGFVIGPLIAALFIATWTIFKQQNELNDALQHKRNWRH